MASGMPTITLNDGVVMPVVGMGSWMGTIYLKPDERKEIIKAFTSGIDIGYRHIDTAQMYNTEDLLGEAIAAKLADGTVKREDLFITTKLLPSRMHPEAVVPSLRESLEKLKLDYVDNFIIHWPTVFTPDSKFAPGEVVPDESVSFLDTWKSMEECKKLGLSRSIGLSNFNIRQLTLVLDNCTTKPSNNQLEVHPYLQNRKLIAFCQKNGVDVVCYCPLAKAGLVPEINIAKEPLLTGLAKKYGKTKHQISLRFLVQEGLGVIPKSIHENRLKENINIFDFEISDEDMAAIRTLDKGIRVAACEDITGECKEYPFRDEYY